MKIDYHPIPRNAIRVALPDTSQRTKYTCGPSCLQAVCHYYGVGKEDEKEFVKDLKKDPHNGTDPEDIVRLAKKYGLSFQEYRPMTVNQLKRELRSRKPVMLMIQAWGKQKGGGGWRKDYKGIWSEGHWVVAIGFDREGIFFEDPSLQAVRGFLSYSELEERWHDVGRENEHIEHYGLALWKPRAAVSAYATRAERIG
jgi:predicted double-glycine peptidase